MSMQILGSVHYLFMRGGMGENLEISIFFRIPPKISKKNFLSPPPTSAKKKYVKIFSDLLKY